MNTQIPEVRAWLDCVAEAQVTAADIDALLGQLGAIYRGANERAAQSRRLRAAAIQAGLAPRAAGGAAGAGPSCDPALTAVNPKHGMRADELFEMQRWIHRRLHHSARPTKKEITP